MDPNFIGFSFYGLNLCFTGASPGVDKVARALVAAKASGAHFETFSSSSAANRFADETAAEKCRQLRWNPLVQLICIDFGSSCTQTPRLVLKRRLRVMF